MSLGAQSSGEPANEKHGLLARLRESRDRYLCVVSSVPEELSRIKPAGDCWSVLECAEHVAVAEKLMLRNFEKRRPTNEAPNFEKDTLITVTLLDRTHKRNAPEPARPTGVYPSLAYAITEFKTAREKTLAQTEQNTDELRKFSVMHPLVGLIDAYQALWIIALHAERHALQIEEIMKCPTYEARVK